MNATDNEVTLILSAINKVDVKVDGVASDVADARADLQQIQSDFNDRIAALEKPVENRRYAVSIGTRAWRTVVALAAFIGVLLGILDR